MKIYLQRNHFSNSLKIWILPSGQNIGDIYTNKISDNAKETKIKKKLPSIEKVIMYYGTSSIIDLFAYMKEWFCIDDRKFMTKNYEPML